MSGVKDHTTDNLIKEEIKKLREAVKKLMELTN